MVLCSKGFRRNINQKYEILDSQMIKIQLSMRPDLKSLKYSQVQSSVDVVNRKANGFRKPSQMCALLENKNLLGRSLGGL